jgi:hypothetical protein
VQIVAEYERTETPHYGLILCTSRQFNRADPRTAGRIVEGLDALLRSDAATKTPFNQRHWLRRST